MITIMSWVLVLHLFYDPTIRKNDDAKKGSKAITFIISAMVKVPTYIKLKKKKVSMFWSLGKLFKKEIPESPLWLSS